MTDLSIAIIEDDKVLAGLLKDLIEAMFAPDPIQVRVAHRLQEVFAIGTIDTILVDLNLPDSYGAKTAQVLKRRYPGVPMIVLTAEDDPGILKQVEEIGAETYVKPDAFGAVEAIASAIRHRYYSHEAKLNGSVPT